MDFLFWIKVVILGAVEGFTEFLPVSSTGHLIVVGQLLGFNDEKGKIFEIVIQTGAMLAIVWEYRARFFRVLAGLASDRAAQRFALNLLVAFMPAAVLGLAFGKLIKTYLFHAVRVVPHRVWIGRAGNRLFRTGELAGLTIISQLLQ